MLGIDHLGKVPAAEMAWSPLKTTSKAANTVASDALVKALIATDLAYCVLLREPVWRMSGIRLP